MTDNINRPPDRADSPGQGNPMLPNNADNSNLSNRSGSTREGIADAASRTADRFTGPDDDTTTGRAWTGSRYYTPTTGREHISGLFSNRADAEDAVNRLEALGVPRSDISVILRNESETADFATTTGTEVGSKAGEGAGAGSVVGGTLGAILGALAATATSIAIPGVGIILAGPIAGALAGAGAGGLTGGLLGALVGAGIPEEHARTYEAGVQAGGVVVVADVPSHLAAQAREILNRQSTATTAY
jgi:hypothetical protein